MGIRWQGVNNAAAARVKLTRLLRAVLVTRDVQFVTRHERHATSRECEEIHSA